ARCGTPRSPDELDAPQMAAFMASRTGHALAPEFTRDGSVRGVAAPARGLVGRPDPSAPATRPGRRLRQAPRYRVLHALAGGTRAGWRRRYKCCGNTARTGALPGAPLSFCRRPREWHACRGALRLSANADAFIGALPEQPPALPTSARGYRLVGRDDQPSSRYAVNGSTARAIASFFGATALGRLTEDGDSHPGISGRASTGMTPADTIR